MVGNVPLSKMVAKRSFSLYIGCGGKRERESRVACV